MWFRAAKLPRKFWNVWYEGRGRERVRLCVRRIMISALALVLASGRFQSQADNN